MAHQPAEYAALAPVPAISGKTYKKRRAIPSPHALYVCDESLESLYGTPNRSVWGVMKHFTT